MRRTRSSRPVATTRQRAVPLRTLVPEEDAVACASRAGAGGGDRARRLLHREAFAGEHRLAHEAVGRLEDDRVRGHEAARREQHDVARHDLLERHRVRPGRRAATWRVPCTLRAQRHRRPIGAVLARVADADARQHDGEHDDGVSPLAGRDRGRGGEQQQQQQRVAQLVPEDTQPGEAFDHQWRCAGCSQPSTASGDDKPLVVEASCAATSPALATSRAGHSDARCRPCLDGERAGQHHARNHRQPEAEAAEQ